MPTSAWSELIIVYVFALPCVQDLIGVATYEDLMRSPQNVPLLPRDTRASAELHELLTQVRKTHTHTHIQHACTRT